MSITRRSLARARSATASPSTTTHSYWRVVTTQGQGGGNWTLDEVKFRAVEGGPNLAVGGTPLSSGDFAGRPASNAFDGDDTTIWSSSGTTTGMYIGYQFPAPVAINEVFLRTHGNPAFLNQSTVSCRVDSSDDGVTWNTEWTHTAMANITTIFEERLLKRPHPSLARQYWRVRPTAIQAFTNWTAAELEFRATAGGASLATGGTPLSSGDFSGRPASNAFDGSGATIWSSSGGAPMYLGYALTAPSVVAEVRILAMNDATFYQQSPTAFLLQCCHDNKTWADAKSFSGITWTTAAQSRLFAYP